MGRTIRERTEIRITSEPANNARVRAAVEAAARRLGFKEKEACSIVLAVDEAITNVIRHGYDGRPGLPIDVTIEPVERAGKVGVEFTICDCAKHVDPCQMKGRDLDDVRPGGLGTHIIRTVMDEVEYMRREPVGMRVCMFKKLSRDDINK